MTSGCRQSAVSDSIQSEHSSLGWSDYALIDLLVQVVLERGRRLRTESLAFLLRAKPLLCALAGTRYRLLRPGDSPFHGKRHSQLVNLAQADVLPKKEVRSYAPLLGFGKD